MKLGLGTVQFGMNYGISNPDGQTSLEEVKAILNTAKLNGIHVLDTAAQYGTSEQILGQAFPEVHSFSIVTKTPAFSGITIDADAVRLLESTFHQSLSKLGQSKVYGLLFHHGKDLLSGNGHLLMEKALELKEKGLVDKVGISVYTAEEIDLLTERYAYNLIQVPLNVLDQRMLQSGHLAKLKAKGIEIHVRSAFLQGLLLMNPAQLSDYFLPIKPLLIRYHKLLEESGIAPIHAALSFVSSLAEVDRVICGVNTSLQLQELIQVFNKPFPPIDFASFGIEDAHFLNPALWKV